MADRKGEILLRHFASGIQFHMLLEMNHRLGELSLQVKNAAEVAVGLGEIGLE